MSARSDGTGRVVSAVVALAACAAFGLAANNAEHARPVQIPGPPAMTQDPPAGVMPSAIPTVHVHGARVLWRPARRLVRFSVRAGYYSQRSGWSR